VVAIDLAFNEKTDEQFDDAALADSIAACGRVRLPLVIEVTQSAGIGQNAADQSLDAEPTDWRIG